MGTGTNIYSKTFYSLNDRVNVLFDNDRRNFRLLHYVVEVREVFFHYGLQFGQLFVCLGRQLFEDFVRLVCRA